MKDVARWMEEAIREAKTACEEGEVPVGCVVVCDGRIVGRGRNRVEAQGNPFAHAELVALADSLNSIDRWKLAESSVYVTVEPCIMCVGAMVNVRVARLVFGTREPRTGACGSVLALTEDPALGYRMAVLGGVEEERCRKLMQDFFRRRRKGEDRPK